jgi:hypothetical protein
MFDISVQIFPTVDDKRERADGNRNSHLTPEHHVVENIGWHPVQQTDSNLNRQLTHTLKNGNSDSLPYALPNHPNRKLDTPNGADDSDAMAACLLVKDDNHWLIEWIAYHYITLPLRYLVIAVDPDSFTSPDQIIQRWNISYIDIRLWKNSDYMDHDLIAKRLRQRAITNSLKNKEQQMRRLAQANADRHTRFISKCSQYHKSRGRKWVAHLDVNEYVVFNNNIPRQPTELKSYNHSIQQNTPIRSLMSTDNVTVLQVMSQIAKEFRPQWSDKGCIAMSSFLFGPRETGDIDMKSTETPTTNIASIEMRKLNTYRYLYHSKEIINNSASGTQHRQGIIAVLKLL